MLNAFRRPSPAMAVALLALFVALGGTAYSAGKINGKSLKSRSVSGGKLKKDTLTGTEINEAKLGKVPSAVVANSATTADSATTAGSATSVADGAVGPSKLGSLLVVRKTGDPVADGDQGSVNVVCPAGTRAISGGGRVDNDASQGTIGSLRPMKDEANTAVPQTNETFTGWRITVVNTPGGADPITPDVWVVCLH